MSKAQYDIYIEKVVDLSKSLVVKSSASAQTINAGLAALGIIVNEVDPTTWKYYLNLAGRYHSTDRLMTVTSLDTLQTIDFTREVLLDHPNTVREYLKAGRYFKELLARFPQQEMLIRGILTPVEMSVSIPAEDGEILYYAPDLVEENETNLIPQLSRWCKNFMVRWNIGPYGIVDDLYAAAQLAVMFSYIPGVILNLRLANCHTRYAHSYHIREFLASHGRLDAYVDVMTKKQMLWLYRNIRYLERNAGKQSTFDMLVQNLLTERGLPLAEWDMRHNLADQIDEIYPDIEFVRQPINFGFSQSGGDSRDVQQMLVAERPVARGNQRIEQEAEPYIIELMENSLSNTLKTKVLESTVLDLTDAAPYTLTDALLNHWPYLATTNQYRAAVVVENPKTGDLLPLEPLEAFIIFLYSYNAARGVVLPNVPIIEAINVRRNPMPTRQELLSINDISVIDGDMIEKCYQGLEPLTDYFSNAAYYRAVKKIHEGQLMHRFMYASRDQYIERALLMQVTGRFYRDFRCPLANQQSYTTWFQSRGLDIATFNEIEHDLLATAILKTATGINANAGVSLLDLQTSMLKLMTQLSSYSVQYLQSINTQPIKVIDWPLIRPGEIDILGKDHIQVDMINVRVEDIDARGSTLDKLPLDEIGNVFTSEVTSFSGSTTDIDVGFYDRQRVRFHTRINAPEVRILSISGSLSDVNDVIDDYTLQYIQRNRLLLTAAFINFQSPHYSLTAAERQILQDRWDAYRGTQPGIPTSLPENITLSLFDYPIVPGNSQLSGVDYPPLPSIIDENIVVDGFTYPDSVFTLPGLNYPNPLPVTIVVDGFELSAGPVYFDGLNRPNVTFLYLNGMTAPTVHAFDGLNYPTFVRLGGYNYPP